MERESGGGERGWKGKLGVVGGLLWDIKGVPLGDTGGQNGGADSRGQGGGHGGYRGL